MNIKKFITTNIGTNTYVVFKENNALIIDPGFYIEEVKNFIEANNLKPIALLLTHGHYDHFAGATYFSKLYNIATYINYLDLELLSDDFKNGSRFYYKEPVFLKEDLIILKNEKHLKINNFNIETIPLPGHTKGGVGYLIEDNLFSGDTLFKGTYGRYDLYGGDISELKESINKLKALDENIKVFPGHGEETYIKYEKNLEVY